MLNKACNVNASDAARKNFHTSLPPLYVFVITLNKSKGVTSRRALNVLARLVRPLKAGHAGTLDPLASGVLVCCVGKATRLIEYVQRCEKEYVAEFILGQQSDTEDLEGNVTPFDGREPSITEIEALLPQFTGEIMQRPPAYSALKVDGKRAYKLARAGQIVELQQRKVSIHRLTLLNYEYPRVTLEIVCGSGTYIRSLGRDLAEALGTRAVMSSLLRTRIGPFSLDDAVSLDELEACETLPEKYKQPASLAVTELPQITLNPEQLEEVSHGRVFECELPDQDVTAAFNQVGEVVALLRLKEDGSVKPFRVFIQRTEAQ